MWKSNGQMIVAELGTEDKNVCRDVMMSNVLN